MCACARSVWLDAGVRALNAFVSVAAGYVYCRLGVAVHAPARRMRSKGR